LLKTLSDRPDIDKLACFIDSLLDQRRNELEFIVLFGSMARGQVAPWRSDWKIDDSQSGNENGDNAWLY
jgi:hypothetical protein